MNLPSLPLRLTLRLVGDLVAIPGREWLGGGLPLLGSG